LTRELHPDHLVHIFFPGAVIARAAQALGEGVVIGDNGAGIADGAEILGGIKAEAAGAAKSAAHAGAQPRAVGLGAVLDDFESMLCSEGADGVHAANFAEEVGHADRAGPGSERRGEAGWVHVEGFELGFDEYGPVSGPDDGKDRGNVGVRRHEDIAARGQVEGLEGENQGVQTVGHADAMFGAGVLRKLGLKGGDFFPQHIPSPADDSGGSFLEFRHAGAVGLPEAFVFDHALVAHAKTRECWGAEGMARAEGMTWRCR
jgi:hypothetical protein